MKRTEMIINHPPVDIRPCSNLYVPVFAPEELGAIGYGIACCLTGASGRGLGCPSSEREVVFFIDQYC